MFDEWKAVNFMSFKEIKTFEESSTKSRCVFRTQASIHDRAFLWIYVAAYNFHYKSSIIDVWLGYI